MVTFMLVCAALSVAPVPLWLKPFQIQSTDDAKKIVKRVLHKPRMTLAEHEEKLAGGAADGRDAPDGQGAAAPSADHLQEERELLTTRDASLDVDALATAPQAADDANAQQAAEPIKLPPVNRADWVARAKSSDRTRDALKSVKAPGAPLDNPCVEQEGEVCARTALDPFFVTLDSVARRDLAARAGVVVLGNSLIASDHVTDVVRARLVERFGDAGKGFLLPDRLSKVAGRRVRTGEASAGWEVSTFASDPPKDGRALC
jgi:hypothetical protein